MKRLLEHIQDDWNLLKDKHEHKIIESYTETGRFITIFLLRKKKVLLIITYIQNVIFKHFAVFFIYIKLIYRYCYFIIKTFHK